MYPFITVWLWTRNTVNNVLKDKLSFYFGLPFIIYALSSALDSLQIGETLSIKDTGFIMFGLDVMMALSFPVAIMAFLLPAWFWLVSRIWKSPITFKNMQLVFAFALIPHILIFFVQLIYLAFGIEPNVNSFNEIVLWIIWLFTIKILVVAIATIQSVSLGKAIVTVVIASVPFVVLRLWIQLNFLDTLY